MAGDILAQQAASAAFTITLASLATSATKVVGRESTAIATDANDYLDYYIGGKITTGTSPTVSKTIDVYAYGAYHDTPTYPVNITGSDAGATMASENQRNSAVRLLHTIVVDATSDRTYSFGPVAVSPVFGGILPTDIGVWVTHDTAVNLNSTGSNHAINYTGVYARYT